MGSKVTSRGQSSTPPPDVVRSTVTMKLLPSVTEAIDERLIVASTEKRMWLCLHIGAVLAAAIG